MRRSQQLICLEKQTKKICEISKYTTKCVNINIKGLFGHLGSWTELSENEQRFHAHGFIQANFLVRYMDKETQF